MIFCTLILWLVSHERLFPENDNQSCKSLTCLAPNFKQYLCQVKLTNVHLHIHFSRDRKKTCSNPNIYLSPLKKFVFFQIHSFSHSNDNWILKQLTFYFHLLFSFVQISSLWKLCNISWTTWNFKLKKNSENFQPRVILFLSQVHFRLLLKTVKRW